MMATKKYQSLLVIFLFWCPKLCFALSNPVQDLLSRLPIQRPGTDLPKGPDRILEDLDLVSSTEPVLAGVRPVQIPNILSASLPAIFRLGSGVFADGYSISLVRRDDTKYTYATINDRQIEETGVYKLPDEPLIMYEFEACPFCRKVREACSMLSLPVTFRPTPSGGLKYRPEIKNKFAGSTFPYMIDPNTNVRMFESSDIVSYLFKVYGNGEIPWTLRGSWVPISAGLGVLTRLGAGGLYRSSNPPDEPLKLWAYEGSPFCKIVRETLCSLEIPHTVFFTPRGSLQRQKLFELTGRFQVPYLEDPNNGVSLFESEAIFEYLEKVYAVPNSPVKYM